MKYFTPQLIQQGQTDDEANLDRHEEEWDEMCDRYEQYLASVRPAFPPGLAALLNGYYLHDAIVREMGQTGSEFVILLRLDTPPRSLLMLSYELLGEPVVAKGVLPVSLLAPAAEIDWMYDEVELFDVSVQAWRHSILLNNGWEVRLDFSDLRVQEVKPLLPGVEAALVPAVYMRSGTVM